MMTNKQTSSSKMILAFVGMPGAGKTESGKYLLKKGLPLIRFGDITEEEIKNANLPLNFENEKFFREKIRHDLGMAAYARKSKPKIDNVLETNKIAVIDGLYSWEEYTYLIEYFPFLKLISIFAEPEVRYNRLMKRKIRPLTKDQVKSRDFRELEQLNKGGPIAIADFCVINNTEDINDLHAGIDSVLKKLEINL